MAKRRCTRKTKAGKRCRAWVLHGEDTCLAHADEATRAKASFGGSENGAKGGHAKRVPKLSEVLRAEVEQRAVEIIAKLFAGLDANRAVVVGTGPKARLELVPDQDLALKTVREIFDRAEGRPLQRTQGRIEVVDQMDREIERLLDEMSANGDRPRAPAAV